MLPVLMALWLCSADTMSHVYFQHQASGNPVGVLSPDGERVQLERVAKRCHLAPDSLTLKSKTSEDFIQVSTSEALRLDVLRDLSAGRGSKEQPFEVAGELKQVRGRQSGQLIGWWGVQ